MDRVFLEYYEEELTHIRALASEFADMHPAVARNLSLDTAPCPDPYIERLLDGVAFLAARTRLKVDAERSRFSRSILEVLYPDLVSPAPATAMAVLKPGQQVQTMLTGHVVKRDTRLVSSLQPGLSTRCTFTTAQDVTLWPIGIASVGYFQDRNALAVAGITPAGGTRAEAALRITVTRNGKGKLNELSLDRLDLHFAGRAKAPLLFDAIFGSCTAVGARIEGKSNPLTPLPLPEMVGIGDAEALLPRTRATFEGYRLLREYFLMPERFHFARVQGLQPVVRKCEAGLEIIFLFGRSVPELSDVTVADFELFATPIINLFERDCNVIELDPRKTRQVLYADRTRPRDFEIYRVTHVEDADTETDAEIPALFSLGQNRGNGWVYSTERRPRRATEDERRHGMTRTSYTGDDVFLAVSRPPGTAANTPAQAHRRHRALHEPRPADTRRHANAYARERRPDRIGQGFSERCGHRNRQFRQPCPRARKESRAPTTSRGGSWRSFRSISSASQRRGAAPIRCMRFSTSTPIVVIPGSPATCARSCASNRGRLSKGWRSRGRCVSGGASMSRCMWTSRCWRDKARCFCRLCLHACSPVTPG